MTLTSIVFVALVVVALAVSALVRNRRKRRIAGRGSRPETQLADARRRRSPLADREAPIAMSRETGSGDEGDGGVRRPVPRPHPDRPQ